MATKLDLAWAAGLFEGEGCFTISTDWRHGGTQHFCAKLGMTDEDVVRRFAKVMGIGTVIVVAPRNPKHSVQWLWKVTKLKDVENIYNKLVNQFGKRRTQRGLDVITKMREYFAIPKGKRNLASRNGQKPVPRAFTTNDMESRRQSSKRHYHRSRS